jgi:type I restriction enzyme S subunit
MQFFSKEVAARGRSTTLPILKKSKFEEIVVPVPPLPLQQKFSTTAGGFERLRNLQREAERQAEHLFQTLLHRAYEEELSK